MATRRRGSLEQSLARARGRGLHDFLIREQVLLSRLGQLLGGWQAADELAAAVELEEPWDRVEWLEERLDDLRDPR